MNNTAYYIKPKTTKRINDTSFASNNFTWELMSNVKGELKRNHLEVSYFDFLGFLVNEVNFPLKESINYLIGNKDILGGSK